MATVPNLGNPFTPIDPPLQAPNRTMAGEPNTTSVLPLFVGEIMLDTTNNAMWRSVNLTGTGWVMLTPI